MTKATGIGIFFSNYSLDGFQKRIRRFVVLCGQRLLPFPGSLFLFACPLGQANKPSAFDSRSESAEGNMKYNVQ